MFYVCKSCGAYAPDKIILDNGREMKCPACGLVSQVRRAPLFLLTGACGAGKSAVAAELFARKTRYIAMEGDILWCAPFTDPEDHYAALRDIWLRMCANISQNGDPVLLAGCAMPEDYARRPAARYFSAIECIALVCEPEELSRRLRARPAWRESGGEAFIEGAVAFDAALRARLDIMKIDTTGKSVDEVSDAVDAHILRKIDP
jgi:broad-specificity NMP kinase